ncbi:MAG: hypothetical protein IJ838_00035 [Paludibacteraceae bacterium]|nr:hypothetical protein [Paludibacteraceae bacterium]
MARTITQIKSELTAAFMADTVLSEKYGFTAGASFEQTFSKVSIENILLYIVAAAIWTLEKLFDTHTAEITDYIATMKPHSLRWYVEKAKAFMYGVPLIDGTDQHDTTGMTDEQMAAAKIVTFSACTEANATLYLKVAKAGPAPLTADEKTAFVAYMHEIKDAGVRIDVISENGDYLKLDMVIYYDPLLINADGESKATGSKVVEDAIKNYIENIPFNGEFRKNELEDAIQAVEGVVMVEFERAEHSETGAYGTYEEVIPYCKPTSGYFKFDNADLSGITYQPYAH